MKFQPLVLFDWVYEPGIRLSVFQERQLQALREKSDSPEQSLVFDAYLCYAVSDTRNISFQGGKEASCC